MVQEIAQFKLEQFSGPLDLLLTLITKKELDISTISLSEVTDQYMRYLDTIEDSRAEEISDFLVVAARLLYIKSRALLPDIGSEDGEGGLSLEDQLRLYRLFQDASKKIVALWNGEKHSMGRVEMVVHERPDKAPENLSLDILHTSMVQLLRHIRPPKPLPTTMIDRAVSLKEKIRYIHSLLSERKRFRFQDIIENATNKSEVIVGFLAILELMKEQFIHIQQKETFGDVIIKKRS